MNKTGLAFSGGGIRSAAFCSGVLRRLLQQEAEPDFLSCVSGGGYTGTAYLDWKYHRQQNGRRRGSWQRDFFNLMRSRAGYLCDWQRPFAGVLDTLSFLGLFLFVSFIAPFILWISYSFPVAMVIDLLFGNLLRADRYRCPDLQKNDPNATASIEAASCIIQAGTLAYNRVYLFSLPLAMSVFFHIYSSGGSRFAALARFLAYLFGFTFALTCGPWFINDFLAQTPRGLQEAGVVLSILVWFFAPGFRSNASLFLLVYTFAYVVYWRVYDATIVGIKQSDELFFTLLFVSGLVIVLTPFFDVLQGRLVHIYNRWRLQKAFYTSEGAGEHGCAGIGCYDFFPGLYCCVPQKDDRPGHTTQGALSLSDLEDVKPQYISNTVVNDWKYYPGANHKYDLLTLSPTKIEKFSRYHAPTTAPNQGGPSEQQKIIPRQPEDPFRWKLEPGDIKLSEAMATSAAALSPHMGKYDHSMETFQQLQSCLGLGMGATVISNFTSEREEAKNMFVKMSPLVIQSVRALPLVLLPVLYYAGAATSSVVPACVFVFLGIHVLLSLSAVINTGGAEQTCIVKLARWLSVHVPFCRYIRGLFNVTNTGPVPPAIMLLSDGGHIENLGILPLLKLRLKKIVVVDGGSGNFRDTLFNALSIARKKLSCSFVTMDGDSEMTAIRELPPTGPEGPWRHEFKVRYSWSKDQEDGKWSAGEGHIIVIRPRRPSSDPITDDISWQSVSPQDEAPMQRLWGYGPVLHPADVDRLTFCCCECCHDNCHRGCTPSLCRRISDKLCGTFPYHATANQFFTASMFTAYHREGYRACMEAKADDFLKPKPPQQQNSAAPEIV